LDSSEERGTWGLGLQTPSGYVPENFGQFWREVHAKRLLLPLADLVCHILGLAPDTDLLFDPVLRSLQSRYLRTLAKFGGRYLPGDLHFPSLIISGKTFGLAPEICLSIAAEDPSAVGLSLVLQYFGGSCMPAGYHSFLQGSFWKCLGFCLRDI